jgi:hypothetical protein
MSPDFLIRNMEQDERELTLWTELNLIEFAVTRLCAGKPAHHPGLQGMLGLTKRWSAADVRERIESLRAKAPSLLRDAAPLLKVLANLETQLNEVDPPSDRSGNP